jgi:hypothetical protein
VPIYSLGPKLKSLLHGYMYFSAQPFPLYCFHDLYLSNTIYKNVDMDFIARIWLEAGNK